ncbi:hypothetical protein HDU98_006469, partial [Podochytrium sp. JEL0797]
VNKEEEKEVAVGEEKNNNVMEYDEYDEYDGDQDNNVMDNDVMGSDVMSDVKDDGDALEMDDETDDEMEVPLTRGGGGPSSSHLLPSFKSLPFQRTQ